MKRTSLPLHRREFITLLGGAAAWPLSARAQQPAMPVIGFLNGASPEGYAPYVTAFRQGLKEVGYVDGQNVAIEYRWAQGQYDRLPALAAESGSTPSGSNCRNGCSCGTGSKGGDHGDADCFRYRRRSGQEGLVASLNRPGGNLTGVTV